MFFWTYLFEDDLDETDSKITKQEVGAVHVDGHHQTRYKEVRENGTADAHVSRGFSLNNNVYLALR